MGGGRLGSEEEEVRRNVGKKDKAKRSHEATTEWGGEEVKRKIKTKTEALTDLLDKVSAKVGGGGRGGRPPIDWGGRGGEEG